MPFEVRCGLAWCRCSGRVVFLDLAADRYYCLSPPAQLAFERALAGDDQADDAIQALVDRCVLVPAKAPGGIGRPSIRAVRGDLLTGSQSRSSPGDLLAALAAQVGARALLRWKGVAGIVRHLERGGERQAGACEAPDIVARPIAAAFAAAGLMTGVERSCLPRALAMMTVCHRRGLRPDLVFGVRLDPFTAHCWVQLDDQVLVGDYEQVRVYTPILAVR